VGEADVVVHNDLEITWGHRDGATLVALAGEVDLTAKATFLAVADVADHAPTVILDVAGVTFIDVVGLGLLDRLRRKTNVVVVNESEAIRSLTALLR
jgi:anti-anti-sigma factor